MPIKVDKLIRSKRCSISLEITREGHFIVRMPRYGSLRDVKRFIVEKRVWIEHKITEAKEKVEKHSPKKFIDGEEFYYLGEKYLLKSTNEQRTKGQSGKLRFNNGFYLEEGNSVKGRDIFIKWYKRQAKANVPRRVQWYASKYNFHYDKIKITSASSRWGSCTAKGGLNFTWKLVLLPIRIVDYVVVHELAHTVHHDHSKRFWAEVEKIMPDYKERRKWLKKNGNVFTL